MCGQKIKLGCEQVERNLTKGNVLTSLIYFSIPYLLSYFMQTLYGMADLFIIGQFDGVASITAVAIGSQIMHMLTVMIVGLAMGTTVIIARAVGAGARDKLSAAIGSTATLFLGVSVVLTAVLLLGTDGIISVMATPEEAVDSTKLYLIVCFIGIPFITGYNIVSSIFRGMGDSKSPMYFIAIACVFNILLDYLFIGGFSMGALGAALATTISQTISLVISLIYIRKRDTGINISAKNFRPDVRLTKEILKVGIPVAMQDGFIQITFLIVTIIANSRGLDTAAAVGIVEKMISLFFLVPSSMLSTVSTLSAQNIGAMKPERAVLALKYGISITTVYGVCVAAAMQIWAPAVMAMFTEDSNVIVLGTQYMQSYIWDTVLAGMHFCFSGYFCAYGLSIISFMHNLVAALVARIPLAYLTSQWYPDSLYPMGLSAPAGSGISVIICIAVMIWMGKHKDKLLQAVRL